MIGGRKTRSNKGKKRTPYGPRTGVTRSKKKFRGIKLNINNKPNKNNKPSNIFSSNIMDIINSNNSNNAPIIKPGTYVKPTFNTINKLNNVNNVNNVNNNAPIIKPGTYVTPTFNTNNNKPKRRKVRSNKGKKRTPYGPRSRTRSGGKFRG